jgi:iron complex outermembrane receptor protein
MYNLKVVQPIGEGTLTGYYNYSDRVEIDYQDLSFQILERRGWDWDNWYPNWNAAIAAADACAASNGNDTVVCDDAYWNASGLRKDDLGYLALDLPIGESLRWTTTAYIHADEGQGLWGTPYVRTPGGAPLSIRTTEYELDRTGLLTALTWKLGNHTLNAGIWYEDVQFTQARRFYGEPSRSAPSRPFEDFQRNPMLTEWEYDFDTETVVFHLQDTMQLSERVRLNAGFRSVRSENDATTIVGAPKTGSIEAEESFLPQIGVNWALSDEHELFAAAARNVKTFAASGTSGPFSTSAAGFAAVRDVIEPETSTNFEAGWRFHGRTIETLLTAYHVKFDDRLLGIQQGPSIVGNPSVLANVGSVVTNGIEGALAWRVVDDLTWFTSAAWNNSEYDDDYEVNSGTPRLVRTSGKQVVDTPEVLLKSELVYDNDRFFVRVDASHVAKRYYTFLNDRSVDAYTLLSLGGGLRLPAFGMLDSLTLQADVTNVTDKEYISTIGSGGFFETDPNGSAQTLLRGAPRQYFLSLKARF